MKYQPVVLPDNIKQRTRSYMLLGMERVESVIEQINSMVIKDLRVHPGAMQFYSAYSPTEVRPLELQYYKRDGTAADSVRIHPHALRQICSKVSLPINYAKMLSTKGDKGRSLLRENLNELFDLDDWELKDGRRIKFLHRIVDGELRGFISRRFNRRIVSGKMLHAFTVACQEVGATPVYASSSDVRFRVRATLPAVFEPVKGQYVTIGVEWSNSDFGAGALEVATFVWFPVSNYFATLSGYRRRHIGSVTETTDDAFEEATFSEETYEQEVLTQSMAIHDAVVSQLNEIAVDTLLDSIADTYDQKLSWSELASKLKVVIGNTGINTLKEALDSGIEELPSVTCDGNGVPQPTRFWVMSACGWLANKEDDADKRAALEAVGGSMIKDKAA